jgi:hypothetical protein
MVAAYLTSPTDVLPPTRSPLGSVLISSQPLQSRLGGYARFGWRTAREVAASLGGDLPTRAEVLALHEQARAAELELKPVTLPDAAQLLHAGVAFGHEAEIDRLRNANMMGEPWARYHDACVSVQLEALGWHDAQGSAVANIGKLWIRPFGPDGKGEVPGGAYLMGWHTFTSYEGGPKGWIQDGLYRPGVKPFHYDGYCDYSSMTVVVWR